MKKLATFAFVTVLLIAGAPVFASGTSGGGAGIGAPSSDRAFAVTERLNCRIVEVKENNTVRMVDLDTEAERVVQLTEKIKISAQNKNEFDGRKKLKIGDLRVGQKIVVTYRPDNMEIVKIKVLKSETA